VNPRPATAAPPAGGYSGFLARAGEGFTTGSETMRALFLTLGVLAVTAADPTPAQEPKDEPPLKSPYTERITYRYWSGSLGKHLADRRVEAYRKEKDGRVKFFLRSNQAGTGLPPPMSEIIDKDGVIWVVTKSSAGDQYMAEVARKPAAAKKP
jgi:hypothetical protein